MWDILTGDKEPAGLLFENLKEFTKDANEDFLKFHCVSSYSKTGFSEPYYWYILSALYALLTNTFGILVIRISSWSV